MDKIILIVLYLADIAILPLDLIVLLEGGQVNAAGGSYSTVGGGYSNLAVGNSATIGGGYDNTISTIWVGYGPITGNYATIGGGYLNQANGENSTVGGGYNNKANHNNTTVSGGYNNIASDWYATVGGGRDNTATVSRSTVGGGFSNEAINNSATVGGGYSNEATNDYATVSGGYKNKASGDRATVGGGEENESNDDYTTVGGGWKNKASGNRATVCGGYSNLASGYMSIAAGGRNNTASQQYSTVAGGKDNTASDNYAFVGGGEDNKATGLYSTIGGGSGNEANGQYATVPGGRNNRANANYSFAAGYNARAKHSGSFVWADSEGTARESTGNNQFRIWADGGVYFESTLKWSDIAEYMDLLKVEEIKEGEIVSLKGYDRLGRSSRPYDEDIIGVVSSDRTFTLHLGDEEPIYPDTEKHPVTLAGRVFVKVNSENGPIKIGDPITSSSTPGIGMKATKTGRVIGYAMEDHNDTEGEVLVFVNLTYYVPPVEYEKMKSRVDNLEKRLSLLEKIVKR